MIKPYILRLSLVYLRSKQDNRFINFISMTSIIGILLGVMVLITVLSIMNGFQTELRERILGMTAHLTIFERDNKLNDWETLRKQILPNYRIKAAAPNILKQALVSRGKEVKGVMVRGINPELEQTVTTLDSYLDIQELNQLKPGSFKVILGKQLAETLNVLEGGKITLMVPLSGGGLLGGLPRMRRFEVAGIMEVGMHEYDSALVLINLKDAANLYRMGKSVSSLQLKVDDLFQVDKVIADLGTILTEKQYYALTWREQHANFFNAIQLEKRIMFIIIFLIIAVATFNIVSTMVMVVNEKHSAIAILRTQGATRWDILSLFFTQGLLIGIVGTFLGCVTGIIVSLNIDVIVPFIESLFSIKFFPPDVYYISVVPSDLSLKDIAYVAGFSFLSSVLATLYPAWRSSKIQPAEILRHE